MNQRHNTQGQDELYEAILSLQSKEECAAFFDDLCAVQEIKAMSQRFAVAKMLAHGHVYNDIVKQTGASTAIISRVGRSLNYGSGGYDIVFARLGLLPQKEELPDAILPNAVPPNAVPPNAIPPDGDDK